MRAQFFSCSPMHEILGELRREKKLHFSLYANTLGRRWREIAQRSRLFTLRFFGSKSADTLREKRVKDSERKSIVCCFVASNKTELTSLRYTFTNLNPARTESNPIVATLNELASKLLHVTMLSRHCQSRMMMREEVQRE